MQSVSNIIIGNRGKALHLLKVGAKKRDQSKRKKPKRYDTAVDFNVGYGQMPTPIGGKRKQPSNVNGDHDGLASGYS
jgi:hypothetical protein